MHNILKPLIKQFMPFAQERMGFDMPPRLFLRQDAENAANPLGKTAYYDPQARSVTLYTINRHPKDIMRSLSHELVHHTQNCRGEFNNETEMGEGYAQINVHLRGMEQQAYEMGNMCFRDWEDSVKGTIYNEHLQKGVNNAMSTKDWKNGEINTLLTEKWGFKFNLDHLNEDCNCSDGDVVEEAEESEEVVEEAEEELDEGGLANKKGDKRQKRPDASPIREEEDEPVNEMCPDAMHGDEEGEVVAVDAVEEAPEARAMELVDELRDIIAQLTGGDVGMAGDEGAVEELEEVGTSKRTRGGAVMQPEQPPEDKDCKKDKDGNCIEKEPAWGGSGEDVQEESKKKKVDERMVRRIIRKALKNNMAKRK